jgi:tyrosine-protein kinase Etk/Wzc
MDLKPNQESAPATGGTTPGSTLLDFLSVLTKYRKFVAPFILGTTLIVGVVALVVPKWYKSTASVFPAEKADLFGALEGVSSLMKSFSPGRALGALTGSSETDRYLVILKSERVLSAVIQKFDLVHVYDITKYPIEKTTKELLDNTEFIVEPEGNLTITVYDKDPQRAADMANYFVELLNEVNTELQVKNARGNKSFIEARYQKNMADLAAAEDSLKLFQQRRGVIAMPQQTEASIKAAAEMSAQLALKEVQAGVLRRTLAPDHPSVIAMQVETEELRHKLAQMDKGGLSSAGSMQVFVPFSKVPDWGMEYLRRYREVEIQYKILQFIVPMYEQAKVEERRETPSVIVLDHGYPAERKSKPKVWLYTLLAFVASTFVAFVVVFVLELVTRLRREAPDRYETLVSTLRHDWFGLRLRSK